MRMMYGKMMLGVRLKLLPVAQRPVLNSIPQGPRFIMRQGYTRINHALPLKIIALIGLFWPMFLASGHHRPRWVDRPI